MGKTKSSPTIQATHVNLVHWAVGDEATDNDPSFNAPSFNAPSLNTPSLNTPSLNTPSLNAPSNESPEVVAHTVRPLLFRPHARFDQGTSSDNRLAQRPATPRTHLSLRNLSIPSERVDNPAPLTSPHFQTEGVGIKPKPSDNISAPHFKTTTSYSISPNAVDQALSSSLAESVPKTDVRRSAPASTPTDSQRGKQLPPQSIPKASIAPVLRSTVKSAPSRVEDQDRPSTIDSIRSKSTPDAAALKLQVDAATVFEPIRFPTDAVASLSHVASQILEFGVKQLPAVIGLVSIGPWDDSLTCASLAQATADTLRAPTAFTDATEDRLAYQYFRKPARSSATIIPAPHVKFGAAKSEASLRKILGSNLVLRLGQFDSDWAADSGSLADFNAGLNSFPLEIVRLGRIHEKSLERWSHRLSGVVVLAPAALVDEESANQALETCRRNSLPVIGLVLTHAD